MALKKYGFWKRLKVAVQSSPIECGEGVPDRRFRDAERCLPKLSSRSRYNEVCSVSRTQTTWRLILTARRYGVQFTMIR